MLKQFHMLMRVGSNIVSVLVIFSFLFAPLTTVFAQEATDTSSTSSVQSDIQPNSSISTDITTETNSDTSTATSGTSSTSSDNEDSTDTSPTTSTSMLSGGGTDSPTTQDPTLFTYQSIAPQVEHNSGALTEKIQLDVPPGRKGLQPDLSLQYNSQRLEDDSEFGYGWSLNIPYIERMNKRGTNNLYKDNYFYSSVSGELATTTATTTPTVYYARVDDGSRIQYNFSTSTNSWTVYDKNGTRYKYGAASSTQQFDASGDTTKVYRWMLQETRDLNDNYVKYTYSRDQNQLYPSMITYTGHGSTDGPMAIVFSLASSTVPNSTYKSAFKISTNKQINQITASISSSTVRTYTLSYGVGNNGFRPLLTSVQETGRDTAGNQLTLPATSFSYASSSVDLVYNATNRGYALQNQAYLAIPATGNGLNNMVDFRLNLNTLVYEGIVDDTGISGVPEIWANSGSAGDLPIEYGTRFIDVNGDGIPDLVRGYKDSSGGDVTRILLNTSTSTGTYNSWSQIATSSVQGVIPYFAYTSGTTFTGGLIGNLNGDGIADYAMSQSEIGSSISYYGNGKGWTGTTDFVPLKGMPNSFGSNLGYNSQFVDINGDGLDDWMWSDSGHTYFCLNTGTSWDGSCNTPWTLATSTLYDTVSSGYADRGMRFMDINGDGLPDFIRTYNGDSIGLTWPGERGSAYQFFLNTGSGWATSTENGINAIAVAGPTGVLTFQEMADWDGDGLPDQYKNRNQASKQDVLSKITYPRGGTTQITYKMTPQLTTDNSRLPTPLLVVTSLFTNDGKSHDTEYDYSYTNGKLFLTNGPIDRKFAGFSTITETGPLAKTITYYNQGDIASTSIGERTDGYAQINHPFREDVLSLGGTLLKSTFYQWDATDLGNNRSLLTLGHQMTQDFDSVGSTHRDHVVEYTYSTTTGDVATSTDLGEVVGSSDGTYSDTGSDTRITGYSYAKNTNTTLDIVSKTTVTDSSAAKVKETIYKYDNLAFGSATTTNPTEVDAWISGGTYATTTNKYDSFGMLASTTDPLSNTTLYSYDSFSYYPASTTDALSHTTKYSYDYATGKVATTTNPNGFVTAIVFDPVGRVIAQKQPDITTPANLNTQKTTTYTDNVFPSYTVTTKYLSTGTSTPTYTYFDGLGRVIQTRTQSPTAGNYVINDKLYNASSVLAQESLPYFASGSSYASATTTSALFQTYTYDPLSRVTTTQNAVGTTTNVYGAWKTTATDPNGYSMEYSYDAWKNLVTVVDPVSSNFPPGAVGYWKLDESSGNASDSSGNGNTLVNTGTTGYAAGLINNAADFGTANTSKMLWVANDLGINGGTMSQSLWTKIRTELSTNSTYELTRLNSEQTGSAHVVFYIYYQDIAGTKQITFFRDTPGNPGHGVSFSYPVTLGTTTWHHIAATFDGTTIKGYLDGVQIGSAITTGNGAGPGNSDNSFGLGGLGSGTGINTSVTASVYMDEVGVWNRALSKQEVEGLYNNGTGRAWGSSGGQTSYTYNANNNLTNITDAMGNVRNFTYNGIDSLTDSEDLHALSDIAFGTWHYVYNNNGQKTSSTDPKGQVTTFTYDRGKRILSEDSATTTAVDITYTYDSCTNGIGKLCSVKTLGQSTNATTTYSYDALGNIQQEDKTIGTSNFTTKYGYDWAGNLILLTYPDNTQVQYEYGNSGLLKRVSRKDSSGAWTTLVNSYDYAPTGDVSYIGFRNGMATVRTYDPSQLYRLTRLVTTFVGGVGGMGDDTEPSADESLFLDGDSATTSIITATTTEEATTTDAVSSSDDATTTEDSIVVGSDDTASTTESLVTLEATSSDDILLTDFAVSTTTEATTTLEIAEEKNATTTKDTENSPVLGEILKSIDTNDLHVQIGTLKDSSTPAVVFSKWGETSFTLAPTLSTTSMSRATTSEDKIGWTAGTQEFRFYDLVATDTLPEGGLEADVVLNKKPTSNVFSFAISSHNLDLFPQRGLDQEPLEEGVAKCTETQCFDAENNVVEERPENIVGSYAAYYKDGVSGDYSQMGGKNYGTGKVFQIYRPQITDAAGSKVWGELAIDQNSHVMTVTVPQEFLEKAEYPVIVDPTFGYSTIGATNATTSNAIGGKYTIPGDGSIYSISQYTKAATGTVSVAAALYSDASGVPNTLLTQQTATSSQGTTAGWVTLPVSQYPATASTTLWMWGNANGSRSIYWDSGATNQYNIQSVTWPAWPTTFSPGTYFARKPSIYATYNDVLKTKLQDLSYTYDPVGNITQIVDNGTTGSGKVVLFGYDSLYRLTSASTTAASSTAYRQTYSYDALGNLTNKSDIGNYFYTGTTTSNYANPHAATNVGGVTFTYDRNGNLLSRGSNTYTWDYRDQLAQSVINSATSTYSYDQSGNRIKLTEGSVTTYYPNQYYQKAVSTSTSYIYANGALIASVLTGSNGSSTLNYIHPDHLNSTNVLSKEDSTIDATYDYYPFGTMRINSVSGGYDELTRYVGTKYDVSDQMNYMNARYQDRARGRFISEDPMFTGDPRQQNLENPQSLNSYSYAEGNPINKSDPTGKGVFQASISGGFWIAGGTASINVDDTTSRVQFEFGPSIGPGIGARLSGSYDNNGSLDPSGPYLQVQVGAALGIGANYTSEAPLNWQNGKIKLKTPLPPGTISGSAGAYIGGTDSVVYKTPSFSYYIAGVVGHTQQTQFGEQSLSGYNINQLSKATINYANSGANLSGDPGFAAAVRIINTYNASLYSSTMSVTTPSTAK